MRSVIRRWRRQPLGTLLALAIVALGVAANVSVFAVLYGAVLAPLPYPASDHLFVLEDHGADRPDNTRVVPGRYRDFQDQLRPRAEIAAIWPDQAFNATGPLGAIRLSGQFVTANLMDLLGRRVTMGRGLVQGDMDESAPAVVLISDDLWRRSFGGRPDIVGQTIGLNAIPHEIAGVLPARLPLPVAPAEVWLPLRLGVWNRVSRNFVVIGRRAGETGEALIARRLDAIQDTLASAHADTDARIVPRIAGLGEVMTGETRTPLSLVWTGSALLLCLVSFNLGVLLVARVVAERHEIAVRRALGARVSDVVLPEVGEAFLIAACGSALGVVLANLALPFVASLVENVTGAAGAADASALSWPVIALSAFVTLCTAGLSATVPALLAARVGSFDVLRVRQANAGRVSRRILVAAQLAGAVVLVSLAALATQTVLSLRSVDLGFQATDVVTARVVLPPRGPSTSARRRELVDDWLRQLRRLASIDEAAIGSSLTFGGNPAPFSVWVEGSQARLAVEHRSVTPGYFDTLRIPVTNGRAFADADRDDAEEVIVVSTALAARITEQTQGADVVGARLSIDGPTGPWRRVVGVVGDTRHAGIGRQGRAELYLPWAQDPWPSMALFVRQAPGRHVSQAELAATLAAVDSALPVFDVRPLSARIDASMALQILLERSFVAFAGLALFVAAVGVFGLLAWVVEARRFEMGLRIALGARPVAITRLVLGELGALAVAGLVTGAIVATLSTRWLTAHGADLVTGDARVLAASVLAVVAVVIVSALPAARRAARTDPASTLRG